MAEFFYKLRRSESYKIINVILNFHPYFKCYRMKQMQEQITVEKFM